jgi:hypothetical protein
LPCYEFDTKSKENGNWEGNRSIFCQCCLGRSVFYVSISKLESSQYKMKAMGVPMVLLATKELLYSALKGGGGRRQVRSPWVLK